MREVPAEMYTLQKILKTTTTTRSSKMNQSMSCLEHCPMDDPQQPMHARGRQQQEEDTFADKQQATRKCPFRKNSLI